MGNRRRLEAVELVQHAVDGRVGDEVEGVLGRIIRVARGLVDKGAALGEAVVHVADELGVGEGLAAELGGQDHGELAEVAEGGAHVNAGVCVVVGRLVEEHAEEGLGAAGVLDRLRGEPEGGGLRRGVVEGPVEGLVVVCAVGGVGREFEEEDYPVDGVQLGERIGIEGEELFELHIFDAEVVEEVCEDALVGGRLVIGRRYGGVLSCFCFDSESKR